MISMTPIVTVISSSEFTPTNRTPNGAGIAPQSLDKLATLEPGQSLRIDFSTVEEARKARAAFYITAARRKVSILLSINRSTITITPRYHTSVIS